MTKLMVHLRGNGGLLIKILLFAIILLTAEGNAGSAQRDDQTRLLEVRRRQLELQAARRQYERTEKLAQQGLVSQTDLDRERNGVATAQLNYQQAVLALFEIEPRISVRSAVKTQTQDGRKFVRLVISNLTHSFDDSQFELLNNFDGADPIPEQFRTPAVNGIFVSLRSSQATVGSDNSPSRASNATISLPYEIHVPRIEYGESKTLNFQLLRDVDTVIVAMTYRNRTQEFPLELERAGGGSEIQVSSSQFSQEADLNGQATYSLTFERPTVDVRNFQLKVVNLPQQISHSFLDLQSQARLSQINFPAGVTRQSLGLRLYLPERSDDQMAVDQPIEFWALALDEALMAKQANRGTADSELAAAGSGKVKLVIIPRGVGRVEVAAASLFSEIEAGETVETTIKIRNTGTRSLNNVKLSADCPLNWRAAIEPANVANLGINGEETVALRIFPPADAGIGDYEVRIKTESFTENRRVESEDKVYRVSLKAKSNLVGTVGIISGVLALIVGIVVFGIRMTKR